MYQKLIASAEYCWLTKNYEDAIKFYNEALKYNQSGRITKKAVRENIKEIQHERKRLHGKEDND